MKKDSLSSKFCFLFLFAGLVACRFSVSTPPTATYRPPRIPTATLTPTQANAETLSAPSEAPSTASPIPAPPTAIPPTLEPVCRRASYQLSVTFDVSEQNAAVAESIVYRNNSSQALSELLLIVEPARREGIFTLNRIVWPGGAQAGAFRWERGFLYLPLAGALLPGHEVTIEIDYTLALPPNAGVLGFTPRQANFGDWYPYIPPYQEGAGWLAYAPSSVGEYLAFDKADFDVNVQVINEPSGWEVIAPGLVARDGNTYHFVWENARSFAWSGSAQYTLAEEQFGDVHVRQYTLGSHAHKGEYALTVIGKALMLYSELFAPYPHDELIAIEADFFDGMEYDGLFYLGETYFQQHDGTPADYLTALTAHETAHQWWYGLVGNDPAWEPWLDEAFCTYSEYLYYERYAPELLSWWWQYRSERFHPHGWVNSTVYDQVDFRTYVDAVYLEGAHFLNDLRDRVGNEAFFATLKKYSLSYADELATTDGFFSILDQQTQKPYQDIVDSYFRAEP
ncbi:MAG: M1 family metallopeptidase [Chloroflexota bacterium]